MQYTQMVIGCILASLPGLGSAIWLTVQAQRARAAGRRAAKARPTEVAALVKRSKEFVNFFTYDGTQQED